MVGIVTRTNLLQAFLLSQAEEMAGNTDAALAAVAEARKTIPDHPLLAFQEAWIHYHAHNWDTAIPLLDDRNSVLGVLLISSSRRELLELESSLLWTGIGVAGAGILMGIAISWWATGTTCIA